MLAVLALAGTTTVSDQPVLAGGTKTGDELALCHPSSGNVRKVSNGSQLSSALADANSGDHIVVAGGNYSGNFTLNRDGTALNPIVVRAASRSNRPRLTGTFNLQGNYGVVEGFEVTGGGRIRITNGDYNRVTRNYIHDYSNTAILLVRSDNNRIDHNEITRQTALAHGIHLENGRNDANHGRNNRIDHNYLHDLPFRSGNGQEPIYVANAFAAGSETNTLIDHNLLVRANSEAEIIGIKTSNNQMIANTVINSRSYVSNRVGHDNVWKNNWIEGTRFGLRVYGKGTQMIGNYSKEGYQIMRGDTTEDWYENAVRNGHTGNPNQPAAENTLLAGNSGGPIVLGYVFSSGKIPVKNTRLEDNSSSVTTVSGGHTGTTKRGTTNINVGQPVKLSPKQVGLDAPDPSCQ